MAVTVHIPTPLRPFLGDQDTVSLDSEGSVGELLRELASSSAELQEHLFGDDGALRNFVNVYVNDEDIRYQSGEDTAIKSGDTVSIVPSIAGGAPGGGADGVLTAASSLTPEELARYSRHIIMPNVGREGQERLKSSSVLLIGAGGLGSPLGLYLAAAGVGRIGMVEFDTVDASNLQRQILYGTSQVGQSKLKTAVARMSDLNPHVAIEPIEEPLTSANALDLFARYDVVADGTDNFPTRYLVNDACVLTDKPNVYGSIFRFEGQVSVFNYEDGPCYRCLYSEPPPPGLVPNCAEGGVFGVLPGVIGSMQANEVIKVLLGIGEVASERLIMYDALKLRTRELKLRKNPECVVCGSHPSVTDLIDYEAFCGMPANDAAPAGAIDNGPASRNGAAADPTVVREISVEQLKAKIDADDDFVLLDVREAWEAEINHVAEDAELIPLGELGDRLGELDASRPYVVHCKVGGRSAKAVQIMQAGGFGNVLNLAGGVKAWVKEIDPGLQDY